MIDWLDGYQDTIGQLELLLAAGTVLASCFGGLYIVVRHIRNRKLRKIRSVLGIAEKEPIVVVCSELANPKERQLVEDREFIYHMKYGDLDALIVVMLSMMKLFPKNDLRLMSSGELVEASVDMDAHIIVIGGPDYNKVADHYIQFDNTVLCYDIVENEIAVKIRDTEKTLYYTNEFYDYGYIERFPNPSNQEKAVIMLGGCHTLGVTAAAKLLSAFESGTSEVSKKSLKAASKIFDRFGRKSDRMAFIVEGRRVGGSIAQPTENDIKWLEDLV